MSSIFSTAESWFQVELATYNDPDEAHARAVAGRDPTIPAECRMDNLEDIIQNTTGYSVACTGWSISTGESLVYQPKDATVSIEYGNGKYEEKSNTNQTDAYELRSLDKKTFTFVDMMSHLQPVDQPNMACMRATPSGSVRFKNEWDEDEKSHAPDARVKKHPNDFVSVNLSDEFVRKFHLHGQNVVRPRYTHTSDPGHWVEVMWIYTEYLNSLTHTECIGTLAAQPEIDDLHYDILLDPTKPLFDFDLDPTVDYIYGPCEYAIGEQYWDAPGYSVTMDGAVEIAMVGQLDEYGEASLNHGVLDANGKATTIPRYFYPHRRISTKTVLTQDYLDINGVSTRVFYIRIFDRVDAAYPTTQSVIVEHPVLKELASIYQNVLTPEVTVTAHDTPLVGDLQAYHTLTKHFSRDELSRNFWIVRPDYGVQIKQGDNLLDQGRWQGRCLADTFTDLVRLNTTGKMNKKAKEKDVVGFAIKLQDGCVANELTAPVQQGRQLLGIIPMNRGYWPDENDQSKGPVKLRSAMFINTRKSPLHLLFETAYEINDDRNTNSGFVGATFDKSAPPNYTWTEHTYAREARIYNVAIQLGEMLSSMKEKRKKPEDKHIIAAGQEVLDQIKKNIDLFPGLPTIEIAQYKITGKDMKKWYPITKQTIAHVDASQAEHSVALLNSGDFQTTPTAEESRSAVVHYPLSPDEILAYTTIAGQQVEFLDTHNSQVRGSITQIGSDGVFVTVCQSDNRLEDFIKFTALPFDETQKKSFHVSLGDSGIVKLKNRRSDIFTLLRSQGLTSTDFTVSSDKEIRLFPGDYIDAARFQCDDGMYYSSLALVSNDLLLQHVISQDIKEILLHQFPLGHEFSMGMSPDFTPNEVGGNPPGMLAWRSRMTEFVPHPLMMSGVPLRKFGIMATLKRKDKTGSDRLRLPPGGEFQLSLLFIKNHQT